MRDRVTANLDPDHMQVEVAASQHVDCDLILQ